MMNNSITVIGHVCKTPVPKSFDDTGNKVVKFTIAVREYSSTSEDAKTLWLDVDAWNGLGDRVLQTITKGREVLLNGPLAVVSYQKEVNGVAAQMTKPVIKLSSFHLCGCKPTTPDDSHVDSTELVVPKQRLSTVKR